MIFLYILVYGVMSKVNKQYKLFLSPTQTVQRLFSLSSHFRICPACPVVSESVQHVQLLQSLSSLSSYFQTCPVYGQCLDPHLAGASMAAVMDGQTIPDCTLPPLVC